MESIKMYFPCFLYAYTAWFIHSSIHWDMPSTEAPRRRTPDESYYCYFL